jgi:hypothetical protein
MARNTAKFNWSQLDRKSLIDLLHQLSPKVVKQEFPVAKFHRIIATHMKSSIPIKVAKCFNMKVEPGCIYLGGAYYSDKDKDRGKCIEISLVYNLFDKKIVLTQTKFNRLCILFADTILHEVIHMRQYRRRKFKEIPDYVSTAEKDEQNEEQSYLGKRDEIDAYGFNIACELLTKFNGNCQLILQYLNEDQSKKKRRSNSWRMYLKAFNHNHNHIIIKRLKSKVIRYLPHAQSGRPYRNKDWIGR